jgi:hypothetical protein
MQFTYPHRNNISTQKTNTINSNKRQLALSWSITKLIFIRRVKLSTVSCYGNLQFCSENVDYVYRVIHKPFRKFRTRQRKNRDKYSRKEHINRQRISPETCSVCPSVPPPPPSWPSRLLYPRVRKSRRDLWVTLYMHYRRQSHGSQSCERATYGHEFRGARNQEWLCWRGPEAISQTRQDDSCIWVGINLNHIAQAGAGKNGIGTGFFPPSTSLEKFPF